MAAHSLSTSSKSPHQGVVRGEDFLPKDQWLIIYRIQKAGNEIINPKNPLRPIDPYQKFCDVVETFMGKFRDPKFLRACLHEFEKIEPRYPDDLKTFYLKILGSVIKNSSDSALSEESIKKAHQVFQEFIERPEKSKFLHAHTKFVERYLQVLAQMVMKPCKRDLVQSCIEKAEEVYKRHDRPAVLYFNILSRAIAISTDREFCQTLIGKMEEVADFGLEQAPRSPLFYRGQIIAIDHVIDLTQDVEVQNELMRKAEKVCRRFTQNQIADCQLDASYIHFLRRKKDLTEATEIFKRSFQPVKNDDHSVYKNFVAIAAEKGDLKAVEEAFDWCIQYKAPSIPLFSEFIVIMARNAKFQKARLALQRAKEMLTPQDFAKVHTSYCLINIPQDNEISEIVGVNKASNPIQDQNLEKISPPMEVDFEDYFQIVSSLVDKQNNPDDLFSKLPQGNEGAKVCTAFFKRALADPVLGKVVQKVFEYASKTDRGSPAMCTVYITFWITHSKVLDPKTASAEIGKANRLRAEYHHRVANEEINRRLEPLEVKE